MILFHSGRIHPSVTLSGGGSTGSWLSYLVANRSGSAGAAALAKGLGR